MLVAVAVAVAACCCLFLYCVALFGEHVSYMLFACYLLSYEGSIHEDVGCPFFSSVAGLSEVC